MKAGTLSWIDYLQDSILNYAVRYPTRDMSIVRLAFHNKTVQFQLATYNDCDANSRVWYLRRMYGSHKIALHDLLLGTSNPN